MELGTTPPSDDVTWSKYGAEFWDDCANAGLSDAAARTHAEAISWIYRVEQTELTIAKHLVRRFAGSPSWESAVVELVSVGYWDDRGDAWEIVDHADVIRASIAAQQVKRDRDKRASRAYRKRVSADVSTDVAADVIADADSQSDNQSGREVLGMPENQTSYSDAEIPATPLPTGICVACGEVRAYRIAGVCRNCYLEPGLRAPA